MKVRSLFTGALILALLVHAAAITGFSQEDIGKIKSVFEKYCSSCHREGGIAPSFEGVVEKMREWASKYRNLDEAVAHEYKFSGGARTYDEMMNAMKGFSPGISEEEYRLLYDYFKRVFEQAAGGKATETANVTETPTKTASPTLSPTETIPKPKEVYTTPPPTVTVRGWSEVTPYNPELHGAISATAIVGIAFLVAAVALAVALTLVLRRR